MIIKNKQSLSTTQLRSDALEIIESGIIAVQVESLFQKQVSYNHETKELIIQNNSYNLSNGRLFVIGGGKASLSMAQSIEAIIPLEHITDGIVSCNIAGATKKIRVVKAAHPYPDENGVKAVEQMLLFKEKYQINQNDVVICLISGGGSALMPQPAIGITLDELQNTTELLIKSGASIHEINTIRKHISKVKGGRLGQHFSPARIISLIISDVIGNDLSVIASGPTVPDKTTFKDAWSNLETYNLVESVPLSIKKHIGKGVKNEILDTPKQLKNCDNYIMGDNSVALHEMKEKAKLFGYNPIVISEPLSGETNTAAKHFVSKLNIGQYSQHNVIILGGETAPKLPENHGKGGRNQQFIAVITKELKNFPGNWVVISVGTDGCDYILDVAGALTDNETIKVIKKKNMNLEDYIKKFNTYPLFQQINSHVITENTGTNVGDIVLFMTESN